MKGRNELHLCAAEMMVAVQEYLQKRMTVFAPTVIGIRAENGSTNPTFIILMESKEKTP